MITLALALALAPPTGPVARQGRGEVLIDADAAPRPTDEAPRPVHGEARLSLGFGAVMQDPAATLTPEVALDLTEVAPVRLGLSAPIRFRMADRAPDQSGVVRARDWDEVGDYFAILSRVQYSDAFVFGDHGWVDLDLRAGNLGRVQLGHGSIVRGYANSLDIDRRRTGVDMVTRVEGRMLDQPAEAEVALVVGDVAGSQILGTRLGGTWAGAGIGFSAVGDPTAPHALQRDADVPETALVGRAGRLQPVGRRGVAALGVDLSYRAGDDWRWWVQPYLDLVLMPSLGGGGHLGTDAEVIFGRRRRARLGLTAELTVGSSGYDPAYFDVFYLGQRWQAPFAETPDQRPAGLGTDPLPKYAWVRDNDLHGVGGGGSVRFAHAGGGFAELGYRYRPGPLGHTFESRVGVDVRVVTLSILLAHRGSGHGFDAARRGSVARFDLKVPIIKYLDVIAGAGWLFALRSDVAMTPPPAAQTGLVTGAGFVNAGVAGRIPW